MSDPMKTVAAVDAKRTFGELLDSARREPVAIAKRGRPVAVLVSAEEYERMEQAYQEARTNQMLDEICADPLKLDLLRSRLQRGLDDVDAGRTHSAEEVFSALKARLAEKVSTTKS